MKLSARSLGKYGVCALAGTGVAWLAGSNAVGNINLWSNPEHAMGRIGLGSFPGARTADLHLALDKTPRPPGAFADMARASLQVEALNAPALRILGLAAAAGGDQAKATQLMGLAQAVTRRDGATQLWFINQAAQQGDIKAALAHYDKALRVNAAIQPQLFPTLGQALANPAVRTAMVPYIKSPPNWMAAFVTSTLAQPQSVANIAETLNTAGGLPLDNPEYRSFESQLIAALATSKQFDVLWRFYQGLHGAPAQAMTSLDFNSVTTNLQYAPVTWALTNSSTITTEFVDSAGQAKQLHVVLSSGEHGPVAYKLLFLRPGYYRIRLAYHWARPSTGANVALNLTCATNGQIIPQSLANTVPGATIEELLTVTPQCQTIGADIVAAAGDSSEGEDLMIYRPSLSVLKP